MTPSPTPTNLILKTENFSLKLIIEDDLEFCISLYQDSELMEFVGKFTDIHLLNRSLKKSIRINQKLPFERLTYCIFDSDKRIGISSLIRSELIPQHCEIGTIIHRPFMNQGIANKVMSKLIQFAFEKLGIVRVYANFSTRNIVSNKLVKNLGFKIEMPQNGMHYSYIEK